MTVILIAYVFSWALLIGSEHIQCLKKNHLLFKGVTSFIFLSMASYRALTHQGEPNIYFVVLMCVGLLCCFFGDVFLSITQDGESRWFTVGAGMFMLAHGVFFVALNSVVAFSWIDAVVIVVVAAGVYSLSLLKNLRLEGKKPLLLLYAIFLGLLMSKAVTIFIAFGYTQFSATVLIGAIMFTASDIILILQMFGTKKVKSFPFFNLLLYYTATMLLAYSIGLG